jgi:hypothetical protein
MRNDLSPGLEDLFLVGVQKLWYDVGNPIEKCANFILLFRGSLSASVVSFFDGLQSLSSKCNWTFGFTNATRRNLAKINAKSSRTVSQSFSAENLNSMGFRISQ